MMLASRNLQLRRAAGSCLLCGGRIAPTDAFHDRVAAAVRGWIAPVATTLARRPCLIRTRASLHVSAASWQCSKQVPAAL